MKFLNLYFVVSAVLVPGFIYSGVVARSRQEKQRKGGLLLRYLTATAFNCTLCSPLIYTLIFGMIFSTHPIGQALCWFTIIFVPVVLTVWSTRGL